jgi:hypothetical protein
LEKIQACNVFNAEPPENSSSPSKAFRFPLPEFLPLKIGTLSGAIAIRKLGKF